MRFDAALADTFLPVKETLAELLGRYAVLVYQREGIDYWKEIKTDPYQTFTKGLSDEESRAIGKCVLLFSCNLTDETKLFQAVKRELQKKIPHYRFSFDNLKGP